jgi:ribosomal protein S18 acetylase RimI-like enzyme
MVRRLAGADAADCQAIRLRSLREHPEAYASSEADERDRPLSKVAESIENPDVATFGAFVDGQLVGIALLVSNTRAKTRHRASINAMYVASEVRGRGIGRTLMEAIISYAGSLGYVQQLVLAVTIGNEAARKLYVNCGFTTWGIDPGYLKIGERYYDTEWMIRKVSQDE